MPRVSRYACVCLPATSDEKQHATSDEKQRVRTAASREITRATFIITDSGSLILIQAARVLHKSDMYNLHSLSTKWEHPQRPGATHKGIYQIYSV